MALAKGLGGGFPIGAVLATENAAAGMTPGTHGCTFGGNPLAAACANAVLDVLLGDGFLERVIVVGNRLRSEVEGVVRDFSGVLETVRSKGLMLGMKCVCNNLEFVNAMREHKVLTVTAGDNVVRFLPPLNIENEHVDQAISALRSACHDLSQ